MKKELNKILYSVPIVILILLVIWLFYLYREYNAAKNMKELSLNFNEKQKVCDVIGTTSNYIYLSRYDKDNNAIKGAEWEVTTVKGKSIGIFETNEDGNGGLIGLDYGEYYLQEKEIPEGYKLKDYRYKVIISASDTSYSFIEKETAE